MRDDKYAMTPHESALVDSFTMKRTHGGKGRGIAFTIKALAYADGTVYVRDGENSGLQEAYGPKSDAANLFAELCARAVREAKSDPTDGEEQP